VTIIVLLVAAAAGVAGLLYRWSARLDAEAAQALSPSFYSLFPSPALTHVRGTGAPRRSDDRPVRPVAAESTESAESLRTNDRAPVSPPEAEQDAETMRFVRPTDFAVQLLPGRLEVLEGATPHREIRFLRAPGEPPHVILGRDIRVTPHYVGLGSPMVSRRHARLDFADNQWIVKNLSQTNPLVVNDDELSDTDDARPLADGDRLELGDVVLRFHAQ
jgi:FHA domain